MLLVLIVLSSVASIIIIVVSVGSFWTVLLSDLRSVVNYVIANNERPSITKIRSVVITSVRVLLENVKFNYYIIF